jgi:hypothetical protein
VAIALSAFMVSSVALAAWTASTTGNKAAGKYGTLQGVTGISAEAFTTGDCFPSSTCTLTIRAHNANAQTVTLTTVTTSGYTATGNGGCTTPDATLAASYNNGGPGWSVPPGDSTINVSNGVTIGGAVSNDCQSQTVTFNGLTFSTST